ncbi:SdpI family protein [Curtobacterium sp. 458]|uniref:SdpI family protein n=1 Tax=Curtobacterium sp. 458 TaxID=3050069 RepID=UPI0025B2CD18|nr:SdpI family protein [Curtobacterium sp. 458]WJY01581.1 SdpI family protein [Curtobacterium sp. 458]
MGGAMVFALSLEIGAAALVTWLTWRGATGTLARNDLAGVRTRLTMSSDAAWRIGHRAALRPTVIAGATSVLWCLVSIAIPVLRHPISVLLAAAVLLVGVLLSIPAAHRAVRRGSSCDEPLSSP